MSFVTERLKRSLKNLTVTLNFIIFNSNIQELPPKFFFYYNNTRQFSQKPDR